MQQVFKRTNKTATKSQIATYCSSPKTGQRHPNKCAELRRVESKRGDGDNFVFKKLISPEIENRILERRSKRYRHMPQLKNILDSQAQLIKWGGKNSIIIIIIIIIRTLLLFRASSSSSSWLLLLITIMVTIHRRAQTMATMALEEEEDDDNDQRQRRMMMIMVLTLWNMFLPDSRVIQLIAIQIFHQNRWITNIILTTKKVANMVCIHTLERKDRSSPCLWLWIVWNDEGIPYQWIRLSLPGE